MIVKIFTKDDYPESREAKELGENLKSDGYNVEFLDADDQHITQQIDVYDIYSYPTFVVTQDDGSEIECWRGKIPLGSDIKMFLNG